MMVPDALLLDLDDTILDITSSADNCWRTLAAQCAPRLEIEVERLVLEVIEARNAFWRDQARLDKWRTDVHGATRLILTDCFADMGIGSPDVAAEIAELFRVQRNDFLMPIPGAIEALRRLRTRVRRLALITN